MVAGGGGDDDVENGSGGFQTTRKSGKTGSKRTWRECRAWAFSTFHGSSIRSNPTLLQNALQNVAPVSYVQSPSKPSLEPKRRRVRARDRDRDPSLAKQRVRRRVFRCRVSISKSGSPPRRSSRLRAVAPVSYVETSPKVERTPSESVERESSVDGYGGEGTRIDDGVRMILVTNAELFSSFFILPIVARTLDELTHCRKCDLVQGKFCGDCLDMGYGENVIEANQNPDWVCPVCRGICNCSLCLRGKELMHDNIKEEMEEGHLVGKEEMKEVTFMGSENVPAEDVRKLDAATIAGEAKKQPRRSTRKDSAHVAAEDVGNLDAAADLVDGETNKQPKSSTRTEEELNISRS
ncbi:hypothetical protein M0R45_001795 [Rubus argutus]|uniref:Zinc-finger domain-containing protein n=1 Tax=Rubus argutus TaxID=59490 RepID=A0AAW1VGQ3_RUBAR